MDAENLEVIRCAISSAITLLYDEVESVCVDELVDTYNSVINELENARDIIDNDLERNNCIS